MDGISVTNPLALASGLYTRKDWFGSPRPTKGLRARVVEVVRLDVDGWFWQMMASGTDSGGAHSFSGGVHWVAYPLTAKGPGVWEGPIVGRWANPRVHRLPMDSLVRIEVPRRAVGVTASKMTITFSGVAAPVTRVLEFESPYFRTADFEFDRVEDATQVTWIDTWGHKTRPVNLPKETLSIAEVYARAGVDVQQSPNTAVVPLGRAGADVRWSDQELNDAMYGYWSRYLPLSQWALWTLFAGRHEDEPDREGEMGKESTTLKGRMFDKDKTDEHHRQGLAVFNDVWEDPGNVPQDYPERNAHIARMRFFAAVHESGHCFNLAHSFDKKDREYWVSFLAENEPEALSFMNYPHRFWSKGIGGTEEFFKQFTYRFSDQDLRFVRHAPEEFVVMGGAPFLEDHGYLTEASRQSGGWVLRVDATRTRGVFEFLEPVSIGVTLTNASDWPQVMDAGILNDAHSLSVFISSPGKSTRQWRPYARDCWIPTPRVLQPGESLVGSFFVGAGLNGWDMAEPGAYQIHVGLHAYDIEVVAEPVRVRIAGPRTWDEELLAQDFFTSAVGRALAFGGTYAMVSAVEALQEVADRLKRTAAARHASFALAKPRMQDRKTLRLPEGQTAMSSVAADGGCLAVAKAQPDEARRLLQAALLDESAASAATFGQRAHRRYVEMYAGWLKHNGDAAGARQTRASAPSPKRPAVNGNAPKRAR